MKILFLGDIFGRPGRTAVKKFIQENKQGLGIDLVIANGDNVASGRGPTNKTYKEMIEAGIDVLTCGDHIWDNSEVIESLEDKNSSLIRPINYPATAPGRGIIVKEVGGIKVLVAAVLGRVFTAEGLDSPFAKYDEFIRDRKEPIKIIDFHAEATSEKYAFGHYVSADASAVIGTHTHVQTADEQIMDKAAYITDVGSCGPTDSVIGVKKELSLKRFLTGIPQKFEVAEGPAQINAVVVEVDDRGKATKIERINQVLN
jgi:metallophosphoesterase (TIGR00282 family)